MRVYSETNILGVETHSFSLPFPKDFFAVDVANIIKAHLKQFTCFIIVFGDFNYEIVVAAFEYGVFKVYVDQRVFDVFVA